MLNYVIAILSNVIENPKHHQVAQARMLILINLSFPWIMNPIYEKEC